MRARSVDTISISIWWRGREDDCTGGEDLKESKIMEVESILKMLLIFKIFFSSYFYVFEYERKLKIFVEGV